MKKKTAINFQALVMLFILMVSSVGLPIISHECAHDNLKDVHIFSSEHHKCKDKCNATIAASETISFQKEPCCSFDAKIFISDVLITAKNELDLKDSFVFTILDSFIENNHSEKLFSKAPLKSFFNKLYGLQYRISIQSFLC